jgi:hypothetical protein
VGLDVVGDLLWIAVGVTLGLSVGMDVVGNPLGIEVGVEWAFT